MKGLKKLFAMMAAVLMVLSLSATAVFAANGNSITVKPNDSGTHEYTAYQIIKGDVTKENNTYVYANPQWGDDVNATEGKVTIAGEALTAKQFLEKYKEGTAGKDLADALASVLKTSSKKVTGSTKANPKAITGLADGYYFIKDTGTIGNNMAETKYILMSVTGDEAREQVSKSDAPSFEKKVKENVKYQNVTTESDVTGLNRDNGYNDVADYNIGDTVPFLLTTKVPDMSEFKLYNIMFEDTMGEGLTYNEDVVVKIGGNTLNASDYTLTKVGNGFKLIINLKSYDATTKTSTAKYAKDAVVRVEYTGTLNKKAKIGTEEGNKNSAKFKFTNNPNKDSENEPEGTTPDDEVIVFTYELDTTKVDGADKTKKLDAEFKLQATSGAHSGKWAQLDEDTKTIKAWGTEAEATVLKSGTAGKFEVKGLDDGTYELKETKAPTGYNQLAETVKITIKAGKGATYEFGSQTWTDSNPATVVDHLKINDSETSATVSTGICNLEVENNKGTTLPETGGMGTTIIYTVGGLLVVGAAIMLITKKRMAE